MDCIYQWLPFDVFKKIRDPSKYLGYVLEPLQNSTMTVSGIFTNTFLDEKKDVERFRDKFDYPIVKIGSNFCELLAPGYVEPKKKEKKSNRGRKPAEPKKKKRIQGSGKYFNSQTTFETFSTLLEGKRYYVKVFRNGMFQAPGVLSDGADDVAGALQAIKDVLQSVLAPEKPIEIEYKGEQMINKKTILKSKKLRILIYRLGHLLSNEQSGNNPMNIHNVNYITAEATNRIIVQFSRPSATNPQKKTTMKILRQKINIEGAVSQDDIVKIYKWINNFIISHYSEVIYDPDIVVESSSSSSSSDEEEKVVKNNEEYDPYAYGS